MVKDLIGDGDKEASASTAGEAGLIRSWSGRDAFIYAFFSVNLVTLGLYIISQAWYFKGGLIPAILAGAVLVITEIVVYAGFISVMPKAGGDYVWQSRVLGRGAGFVLAMTGWCFILWLWTPLYADMLRQIVLVPLAAVLGFKSLAITLATSNAVWFGACVLTCLFIFVVIALGMESYAKVQRFCFWAGNISLLVVLAILLIPTGSSFAARFDVGALSLFGLHDATASINAAGRAAGSTTGLWGGSLSQILLLLPFLAFWNLWPNCGASLSGEVRGAHDFRRNLLVMSAALLASTVLAIVILLAIERSMGFDFYMRANAAYWQGRLHPAGLAPVLPFWPYPVLLALLAVDSPILRVIVVLGMSSWFFGWAGTIYLSSTRILFSAALDRLLPGNVAELSAGSRSPIKALLYMVVPGLIVSALYVWNAFGFAGLTLMSTLVIAVTYLGTGLAAILLPFVQRELYRSSPLAAFRIGPIPLISVFGLAFMAFIGFLLYEWMIDPADLYGISLRNSTSVVFMVVVYGIAIALYLLLRARRRQVGAKEGEDLFEEAPQNGKALPRTQGGP
ncbi:MAG: APC family permease [Spirochaetota bacterium]